MWQLLYSSVVHRIPSIKVAAFCIQGYSSTAEETGKRLRRVFIHHRINFGRFGLRGYSFTDELTYPKEMFLHICVNWAVEVKRVLHHRCVNWAVEVKKVLHHRCGNWAVEVKVFLHRCGN